LNRLFIGRKTWFLLAFSFLTPVLFSIYTTALDPRPYYILETDIENDYYYNARLLEAGRPLHSTYHPGTPIQFLGYLILLLSGPEIESTQSFFNIAYFVVSLVTALSVSVFAFILLRKNPVGLCIMTLATIIAWPSFLTYMNYFGSDSFILAFGLPTITIFWKLLENSREADKGKLLLCGVGMGACLATKFSFLPVALALLFAGTIHVLLTSRDIEKTTRCSLAKKLMLVLILPISMGICFLVLTVPMFGRLPFTLLVLFFRQVIGHPTLNVLGEFFETFGLPFGAIFPLAILIIIAATVGVYLLIRNSHGSKAAGRPGSDRASDVPEFDCISGGLFLLLMLFAFMYTTATVNFSSVDPGIALRNVSPCALFIPFLILYCHRLIYARRSRSRTNTRQSRVPLIIASVLVAAFAVGIHLDRRHKFIQNHKVRSTSTIDTFRTLFRPDSRIAFWDGSPDDMLGEVGFHFWGNYRYAADYFDDFLIERFRHYTFFRLREIERLIRESVKGRGAPTTSLQASNNLTNRKVGGLHDRASRIYRWWHQVFPNPYGGKTSEIVTGEAYGVEVSTIAFPEGVGRYELRGTTLPELFSFIQSRFGTPNVRTQSIQGINWVVIDVDKSAEPE